MAFVPASSFLPAALPHRRSAFVAAARPAHPAASAPRRRAAARPVPTPSPRMVASSESPSTLVQTGDQFVDDCINAIRFLAIDAVEKAKSGHPGMPMGMAPAAYVLWNNFMNFNPKNPSFINRDRFVLSAGHGSMLLYALLYLFGFDSVSLDDIKQFRQFMSVTPGHPENFETAGVEVTTGPLGQGICNAVGIAMAEAHIAATYNKPDCTLIDNYTYCIMGDGCHMEGVSGEACSLAGHYGLGKLIAIYDDNHISIDGHTDISFTEDVGKRFEAYGWQVINVPNGNTDIPALERAIADAKACTDKPTLIKVTTIIGYGSPNKSDSHDSHGAALGTDEVAATREYLGWAHEPFHVPQNVLDHYRNKIADGAAVEARWNQTYATYKSKYPELAAQFEQYVVRKELPDTVEQALVDAAMSCDAKATRQLSQLMLNTIAPLYPPLVGGSADLAGSNLTIMKGFGDFQKATPEGRNLRFGVREHGMVAIANGINLAGYGLRPYTATFFVFTDYARGAMRLSSLSRSGVINVATHDSVFLGEDGPTHQPIEHLASFRAMPNHYMYRPADPIETAAAYAVALSSNKTPTTLALTRQKTCVLEGGSFEGAKRGMYVLSDDSESGMADVILIGTGSETELAQEAAKRIRSELKKSVRVVSAPCVDVFEEQSDEYKDSVLPAIVPKSKRLVVEAASSFGWSKYADNFVCIDTFGISAPGQDDMKKHFGMTVDNVYNKAKQLYSS